MDFELPVHECLSIPMSQQERLPAFKRILGPLTARSVTSRSEAVPGLSLGPQSFRVGDRAYSK